VLLLVLVLDGEDNTIRNLLIEFDLDVDIDIDIDDNDNGAGDEKAEVQ